jgi:hypothetical protein
MVPAAKDELLQKMGWYPELKRPALAPRIGIAVHFSEVPQNFRAHPMPIGSAELASAVDSLQSGSGAGGGGAGGNTSSGRASGRSSRGARGEGTDSGEKSAADTIQDQPAAEQLSYYLGEFGESLLDALDERMETGEYGPVLQELVKQAAASPSHAGDGQAGENALGTEQAAPPPAAEEGRLAGRGRRAGTSAAQAEGVAAPGSEQGASTKRWSAKSTSAKDTSTPTVSVLLMQLSPCVIWLGKGNAIGEITKRAEAADIDVLAVFSLSLKENRTGVVNNTTTLRIHNLRTQKLISSSPEPLANVAVYNKRKKDDKATDPVKSEVLKALTAIDPVLKPAPLPARTADVAKQRIAFLVSTKPEEPLPVVVEARLYLTKGLMTEDEFLSTAKTLLGDDGFAKLAARAAEGDQ